MLLEQGQTRTNVSLRLTEKQLNFVRAVTKSGSAAEAARLAGFSEPYEAVGQRLLQNAAVLAAIRIEVTRLITAEGLPLAYRTLTELAKDTAVPPAVRRACARDLIDRAGFVAPKAAESDKGQGEKPLSEMTSEELRAFVDKLECELGARAVDITPGDSAQVSAQPAAKPLAFLD